MKHIRSYVTNPETLQRQFLDFNSALGSKLKTRTDFIIHKKSVYEPTISPIIGSGLPKLEVEETDRLRAAMQEYVDMHKHLTFKLSPDVFAEIFSNVDRDKDMLLHTFSTNEADFILHNVYSDDALDAAFDHLSPALFIPEGSDFTVPNTITIYLFAEDVGSDLKKIIDLSNQLGSSLKFVIQTPTSLDHKESTLEKITKANQIDIADLQFTAHFVEEINQKSIDQISNDDENKNWMVFQHSFLLQDFKQKSLKVDLYQLLVEADCPIVIV